MRRFAWHHRLNLVAALLAGMITLPAPAAHAATHPAGTDTHSTHTAARSHSTTTLRPGVVSPAFASNVAPALASEGNRSVAVVTGTDGRIFYTWWDLGGGGQPWLEIPGGMHTNAAPAVDLVGNGTYMFIEVKGPDGLLYLDQGTPGGSFVGWQGASFATNVGPALAAEGNRSVVVATATDGRIFYDWWDLGGGGHGWREVPGGGSTNATPAVDLVANGTYMFVDVTGLDGQLYLNQGTPGGGFVGWRAAGAPATNVASALAAEGNRSVAVVTGTDGRIFYTWWDLGGAGNGWREVPGGGHTDAAPAVDLVANGTYMFILIKGLDGNLYLNQGTPGGGFVGWR